MSQKPTNNFADEYRESANKVGGFKDLGDAVGMPDKEDWQNIVRIINKTRKETTKKYGFDILVDCIANARADREEGGYRYGDQTKKYGLVNKGSNMRHVMELPEEYQRAIEEVYPVMFRSKKHFAWFCNSFKELVISEKY